jgi:hypothetical protein
MPNSENIGELYVKIRADVESLNKELSQLKTKLNQESAAMGKSLSFKAKFDNSIAKLKITELQSYRDKLQARFNQQLKTNVDAGSINRTKTLISGVNTQLEGLGKTGMSTGAKIVAGFVALGGIRGAFRFVSESIKLFYEQAKAVAGVEQAVRRTGGAAGFTAIQLKAMASELQNITGVGDEEILKGVTKQLLTFTLITGSSFKRAQEAVLDLNAVIAGGEIGGLTSQAIQLGKALENPIAGVGALSRAGVTFTEEQKKMIAGFVRQNDLMSAQDIILKEIENKYGGQAKALAGALGGTKQYAAAVGDLKEAIGGLIASIPGLNFLIVNLTGGMKTITQWFQGAAYEAEQLRLELDNLKSAASQIQVKGIGIGDLSARKKANEELIKQNEVEGNQLKEQLKDATSKFRLTNDEVDALEKKLKTVAQSTQIARGENEAYTKQIGIIENINKSWEKSGKTLGQVQDRITFLEEQKIDLEVKGIDAKKIQKEIDDLNKYIDTSKSDKTITTKFESQIPSGYTAQQVAEFEKLKFAVQDYVDFRTAQIDNTYNQEIAKAKGNAVEIAKAEENKLLAYARFNQEMIDLQKEGSDATNKIVADSLKDREKELEIDLEKESQLEAENYTKRQDALKNFYDQSSTLSEEYFKYKIQKIAEESAALLEATGDPTIAKQLEIEQLKELEQEYFDWRMKAWQEQAGIIGDISVSAFQGMSAAYDVFWQSLGNADISGSERMAEVWNSLKSVTLQSIGDIVKGYIQSWIKAQVIGDAFKSLELAKGIALGGSLAAAYAPAAAFASIMSFGGAAAAGAAGLASTVALAQVLAIPKFAKGGDFIVPPGFNNDSYPMLVESGERVQVTPANQVNKQDSSFSELSKKLDILNKNLIAKDFSPTINTGLNIDGRKLTKSIISIINKMEREGLQIGNL